MLKKYLDFTAILFLLTLWVFLILSQFKQETLNLTSEYLQIYKDRNLQIQVKNDLLEVPELAPPIEKINLHLQSDSIEEKNKNSQVLYWIDSGPKKHRLEFITADTPPVLASNNFIKTHAVEFNEKSFVEKFDIAAGDMVNNDNISTFAVISTDSSNSFGTELQHVFGWGNCEANRFFLGVSNSKIEFHHGRPEWAATADIGTQIKGPLIIGTRYFDKYLKLYLNGEKISEDKVEHDISLNTNFPLLVGDSACGFPFKGQIYEILVLKNIKTIEFAGVYKSLLKKYGQLHD